MTTLQQYRNKILNPTLLVGNYYMAIGLLIYDSLHFEQTLMLYQNLLILLITIICGVSYIFRKRIKYSFRAWIVVLSFFIISIYNFYILGYAEFGSLTIFLVCIVACYVFLNLRQAIFVSALTVLTVTFIFILYLNNMIPKNCSIDFFINSREIIYSRLFTDILYIASISTVLYFFIYYFISSLNALEIKNKELDEKNAALINEIEKRKQLEQANRFQEYKFKTIFNSLQDAVIVYNYNLDLIEANETYYKRTGYATEEIKKLGFQNLVVPEQRENMNNRITSLVQSGTLDIGEYTVVNKNDEKIIIEVKSSLMTYDNAPAVLSIFRDITKRKEAELALAESEYKLKTIFNNLQDAVLVFNYNFEVIEANKLFYERSGYSAEELNNSAFA